MKNQNLVAELENRYERDFSGEWVRLTGGYECDVWWVGDVVVRVCPEWRTDEEIAWVHGLIRYCAAYLSLVVAPILDKGEGTFFRFEGRGVVIFPFVEGEPLDRNDIGMCVYAGWVLAWIHQVAQLWTGDRVRPKSGTGMLENSLPEDDPVEIQDQALDQWYEDVFSQATHTMGFMHGDYYRGNVLCKNNSIVGVIDWDECSYGALIEEVAWSAWEFGKTAAGDELDRERTAAFLDAYAEHWFLNDYEREMVIPLIRWRLREEIRRALGAKQRGETVDEDYLQSEIRAFHRLRDSRL